MNTFILLYVVILSITLAAWNAYVILWGVYKNLPNWNEIRKTYSRRWHAIGWILRFELALPIGYLLFLHPGVIIDWWLIINWTMTYLMLMWLQYDFTINLIRFVESGYPDIWYVDDKGVNAWFLDRFHTEAAVWIFRGILLVGNIVSWVLYALA